MKKFILIFAATFGLLTTGIFAQEKKERHDGEQKMEERIDELVKELELTPEQSVKIREINAEYYAKHKALKKEMHEVRTAKKEAIKLVLTPEQQAKMKEIHHKKKGEKSKTCCEKTHEHKKDGEHPRKQVK